LYRGHFKDELWGLCVDKTQKRFYSAGEDGMVASWDIASMR
jgi:hypothetical protein